MFKIISCIELLVVGPGGSGQSYLMKYLNEQGIKTNNFRDKDGFKHTHSPNKIPNSLINKPIIYIYRDSLDIINSHYRRNWSKTQITKISGNTRLVNHNSINTIEKYYKLVEKNSIDYFQVYDHFIKWYYISKLKNLNIMFIHFDEILKNNKLKKFLQSNGFVMSFDNFIIKEKIDYSEMGELYPKTVEFYDNIDRNINDMTSFNIYEN